MGLKEEYLQELLISVLQKHGFKHHALEIYTIVWQFFEELNLLNRDLIEVGPGFSELEEGLPPNVVPFFEKSEGLSDASDPRSR